MKKFKKSYKRKRKTKALKGFIIALVILTALALISNDKDLLDYQKEEAKRLERIEAIR